jgi:hypothetical protein
MGIAAMAALRAVARNVMRDVDEKSLSIKNCDGGSFSMLFIKK